MTDVEFVKKILPSTYEVKRYDSGNINCMSETGIFKNIDAEDDEHWMYVFEAIKKYFGSRFRSDPSIRCPIFTNQEEIVDRIFQYFNKLIDYDKAP